jgi:hypothetical protein
MGAIDITDAALIHAVPQRVFEEIMRLMAGEAQWWLPHLVVRAAGERAGHVGSLSEIIVPKRARFIARIEQLEEFSLLRVRYIDGDFRGDGLWRFEAVPEGTRISLRWQPMPTRWLARLLSPLVQRNHSRVMQLGFRALDVHLNSSKSAPRAR